MFQHTAPRLLCADDLGAGEEDLVAPDVIVVGVAVHHEVDGARGVVLRRTVEIAGCLRRKECIEDNRPVSKIHDTCVAYGLATISVDGSIDTIIELVEYQNDAMRKSQRIARGSRG